MFHYRLMINVLGLDNIRGVQSPLIFFLEVYMTIKKLCNDISHLEDGIQFMLFLIVFLSCIVLPYSIYDGYKTGIRMHEYAQVQLNQDVPSGTSITINLPSANTKELNMIIEHGYIITSIIHNSHDGFVYITCEKR